MIIPSVSLLSCVHYLPTIIVGFITVLINKGNEWYQLYCCHSWAACVSEWMDEALINLRCYTKYPPLLKASDGQSCLVWIACPHFHLDSLQPLFAYLLPKGMIQNEQILAWCTAHRTILMAFGCRSFKSLLKLLFVLYEVVCANGHCIDHAHTHVYICTHTIALYHPCTPQQLLLS